MDANTLGIIMIGVGVILWLLDRYVQPMPKTTPTEGRPGLESVISDTVDAAKKLPFPTLLVVLGFILVLLDNGWISFSAGV